MRASVAILLIATVASSGCVTELLADTGVTVRNIGCSVISADRVDSLNIVVLREPGTTLSLQSGISAFMVQIELAGRPAETMVSTEKGYVEPEDMEVWLKELPRFVGKQVRFHFVIVADLGDSMTFEETAPGIIYISQAGVTQAAERLGRPVNEIATQVLLHAGGHGIGLVNAGIPLNSTSTEGREIDGNHEPGARSIMGAGWHSAHNVPQSNQTAYSAALMDDLRAAQRGICA